MVMWDMDRYHFNSSSSFHMGDPFVTLCNPFPAVWTYGAAMSLIL